MFYVGKQKISPGFFSKGESSGNVITAKNYTNANISAGDKVWINQKAYESGSSINISRNIGMIFPDFDYYWSNGVIYRTSDNISTGYSTVDFDGYYTITYSNGLTVLTGKYYDPLYTYYYKNGHILFGKTNAFHIINRPDLMLIGAHLVKINPETGEELHTFTDANGGEMRFQSDAWHSSEYYSFDNKLVIYGGKYIIDDINYTVTGGSFSGPTGKDILGVTSDKKYIICKNSMWKYINSEYVNVTSNFPDIYSQSMSQYNHVFYQSTNLLTPILRTNSSELPTFKYYPETDTWDSVPVNREALLSQNITFNPNMTQYAASANSKYKIVNLQSFQKNSLYSFKQSNMNRDTLTGVAKENIANGEEGRVTTILP